MADEDWESELDNGPACVPSFSNPEPDYKENFRNSFSANRDVNENFGSSDQGFGSQKDDDLNQNFESSSRGFGRQRGDRKDNGFSRGRSDRGRGGSNGTFNKGFGSFDSQERTGFGTAGFGEAHNDDQSRSSRGGFNNESFRSRGRRGGGRGGFHSGDSGGFENKRDFGRRGDDDSGGRGFGRSGSGGFGRKGDSEDSDNRREFGRSGSGGFGRRGDNEDSDNRREFGRSGGRGGFGRRGDGDDSENRSGFGRSGGGRDFGRRGDNDDSGFGRSGDSGGFGGFGRRGNNEESGGSGGFGRSGDSGGFGGFGRRGNNEESDGSGGFGRSGDSGGFESRRDFGSRRGGYRGRNEDVGVESGKGQDNFGNADTGPKVTYVPPPPPDAEDEIFRHYQTGINFDKYDEILVDVSGTNAPPAILSFEDADLSETLTKNVYKAGYVKLTPIQKHSIPIVMAGRDLMACAQTGSGKTAAFLLPILAHMMKSGIAASQFKEIQEPEAIIVAPTRELINQIYLDARKFSYGTVVRPVVIYGGTQTSHSLRQIFQGCNILCATPGRLLDVINKEKIGLSKVKYLVLDEADRMLDMGFMEDVRKLLSSPGMPTKEERQTLMFSATFPAPIQSLAREILKPDYIFVVVGQVGGACSDVEQQIIEVDEYGKRDKLLEILQSIGHERTMVFVKTKKKADFIATVLCQEKLPSTSIHGDREQREREKALHDFRSGQCPVIVATSVAARGLDIENVQHVINFDIPGDIDEYVHRIGRTGRCGNTGKAISFFDRKGDDEQKVVRGLVKILTDAHQEVPAWLEEIAFSAHGTQSYSSHPSKFASVDDRKRGGFQEDNSYSGSSFTKAPAPAEEEEDWG
ncbi:probable ATP-dependent RNA helicase DDX4 isoform X4 [Engystomops pustulosus]|uniref:probable ATP-dependent RNA helicase DDX4 isoform X4 n=1 Tax=Engystomops pustulosus TaxID=76066 RepID=UPI003AFA3FE6